MRGAHHATPKRGITACSTTTTRRSTSFLRKHRGASGTCRLIIHHLSRRAVRQGGRRYTPTSRRVIKLRSERRRATLRTRAECCSTPSSPLLRLGCPQRTRVLSAFQRCVADFFITVTAWALGCLVHTSRPHSRCACAHTLFVRFSTRLVSPPSLTLSSLDRRGYNIRSVLGLTLPVRSFFLMEYMTEYFTYLIQLNVMIIFQQQWGGATLDLHEGR